MEKKRRKFYIYPEIQLNLILLLSGSGIILSLFFSVFFLYINSQTTSSLLSFVQSNPPLAKYLLKTQKLLILGSMLMVLLSGILLGIIALFRSHKVAGPIYRLEKIVQDLKEGKTPGKIILRKGDKVTKLASLLEEIGLEKEKEKSKKENLLSLIENIDLNKLPEDIKEKLEEIKKALS